MHLILTVLQIVFSTILILTILLQQKSSGLGSAIGGSGNDFQVQKRGAEKFLANVTVFFAILFCLNAFLIPFFPE